MPELTKSQIKRALRKAGSRLPAARSSQDDEQRVQFLAKLAERRKQKQECTPG